MLKWIGVSQIFIVKKFLDMALGVGWISVFGVKFLNRADIRNFHECTPLHRPKLIFEILKTWFENHT